MSYCLNPACQKPQNPKDARYCQNCGAELLLGSRFLAINLIGQGGFGKTFLAIDRRESDGQKQTARDEQQPSESSTAAGDTATVQVSARSAPSLTHNPAKTNGVPSLLQVAPPLQFCVIKQLLPHQSGVSLERSAAFFRKEAERLAVLGQHPQIPALLAHYEQPDAQYLVQEFIDGQNLEQVLAEEKTFNEAQVRELLADLLPVLRFVHSYQVIHRDIKPENIIRPYQGKRYALVDFGAAKAVTDTVLARTGTVIGSAGYVAPEQAMGKADFSSDLYSLGVTCIHLLTGLHPFDLYSISEDAWVWRQYLPQPVSAELRRVLDRLLQKGTGQRYRNATEVLQDLRLESSVNAPRPATRATGKTTDRRSATPPISEQWRCVQTITGHTGAVTALAISSTGRVFASGSSDRSIKLWDLATGELLHTFAGRSLWAGNGHQECISSLAFSPNGRVLFSSSQDGTVKQWDLARLKLSHTLPRQGWLISALAVSPDGYLLASGSGDGLIQLWDLETEALISELNQHQEQISALAISPDSYLLASSSYDRTICLWNLETDRLLKTLKGHVDRVSAVAISPDGATLISGSWDKTVKLWHLGRGEQIKVLAAHRDRVNTLAVRPQGDRFTSGSEDGSIGLWHLATGDRLCMMRHDWGVNALAFSPDGELLVSGSADETIKIWQAGQP